MLRGSIGFRGGTPGEKKFISRTEMVEVTEGEKGVGG